MNRYLTNQQKRANFTNGTIDTVPYFSGWFITGGKNSLFTYSMVGQSPTAGGTTGINNQIIPLITILTVGNTVYAVYDPTVNNDPQGSDIDLVALSPLYDATTTYPGPPPDTGEVVDTAHRAEFRTVRAANWHTVLNAPMSSSVWIQFLDFNKGEWALAACGTGCTFPVMNLSTISANFKAILNTMSPPPPNSTVPIIVTDFLAAFDPSTLTCCILGYHTSQTGIANPAGLLVWTWATFIPHSATNPFGPFGEDVMVLSHELSELVDDPFVGNKVAPWVSISCSGKPSSSPILETGDAIETMCPNDVIYLNASGGLLLNGYHYHLQNVATLEWFTRVPYNGIFPNKAIFSWPDENVLSVPHLVAPLPVWCGLTPHWVYGEGSAGFLKGPCW